MSNRSKPIRLVEGHLTLAEKRYRAEAEKELSTDTKFYESAQVKNDEIAHDEFVRLQSLYAKISHVDGLDQQIINRYCLEISNQNNLQNLLQKLESVLDDKELKSGELVQLYKSISGVLMNITKSKELLLKYEDRLFLNPASRIRSIPKKPPEEEKQSRFAAFKG